MRTFKRKISFLLAAMMILSSLMGCQGGGEQSSAASGESSQASEGASGEAEIPEQTAPVKFYCRTNSGRESAPDNAEVLAYIEEQSGIKLEITAVAQESFKEKIDLMIASEEKFDGMNLVGYDTNYSVMTEKNAIVPLNDLLDKYGPHIKEEMAAGMYTTTDKEGNIWALPRAEQFPEGYVPTIRQDWLDKLGMEMPSTIEEIDAYLEAVKTQDPNGNGEADEIPFLPDELVYGCTNFFPYFLDAKDNNITVNSGIHRYMAEDGTIWPIYCHPDFIKVIEKFRDWYEKGYLHQEIHALKSSQITDLKTTGVVGMTAGWYSTGVRPAVNYNEANPDKDPISYIPIPPLENAPGQSAWPSNPEYAPQIVVMKNAENPEALIRYFDWILSSPENVATVQYGLEGKHWNWVDEEANTVELIGSANENYNQFYALANLYYDIMPVVQISPDNKVEYEYDRFMNIIRDFNMAYPFDAHIPYYTKGTDAEFLTADGQTLIEETLIGIIVGTTDISEWESAVETYKSIEGDIRSKVWTEQYNEFMS